MCTITKYGCEHLQTYMHSNLYGCNETLKPLQMFLFKSRMLSVMLASHCPEVDTRWYYEWNFEFRTKFVPNFDISQSTAEVITMPTECHTLALKHNTKVEEGITKATRRCDFKYDIYTTAIRWSHDAVRRLHGVVL